MKLKRFNEFFLHSGETTDAEDNRFPADDEQQEVDSMCTSCGCDCITNECTCDDCDCEACCNKCCDDQVEHNDEIRSYSDYRRMSTDKPVERRRVIGDEVVEKKKFNFDKKKNDKKKDDKKEDKKETKGLSASQKKLPAGLQKAILAKKKK